MPADFDRLLELLEEERAYRASGRIVDPWSSVVGDLSNGAATIHPEKPLRFNPRPAGVIRPGSTTEAVYKFLRRRYSRSWLSHAQIVRATGCSAKAVDWALIFLRRVGRVESSPDPESARYLRYRAKRHGDPAPEPAALDGSAANLNQDGGIRPGATVGPDPQEVAGGPGTDSAGQTTGHASSEPSIAQRHHRLTSPTGESA